LIVGIIPARFASTRFPGKLLADLNGRPVLQWTWERASRAKSLDRLMIAAADEKIARAARAFGAEVIDVFKDYSSGSDRIAEAVRQLEKRGERIEIVVNIQGDEPLLDPAVIDAVVERLIADPDAGVATAAAPINSEEDYLAPSCVKVVIDARGHALYFSRAPVPAGWKSGRTDISGCPSYRHIGIYAYRAEVLKRFTGLSPSPLELTEKLEQLRLLEHGVKFAVVVAEQAGMGVDTEEDLERVKRMIV
jgi:3-deoxy-manno-octulosonate cytidylyltransferase (CMP-KDO synthetase)